MKCNVTLIAVTVVGLCLAGLCVAAEQNAEEVNPEVTKLLEKLSTDIDALSAILPDDVSEQDRDKMVEEFDRLREFAKTALVPLCTNPVFVQEVAKQNAQGASLADIQAIDKQWTEAEDELPIHVEKMGNACAQEILRIAKDMPLLGETFVMDNQGANVGQNALTSDYWQGDEPKWQNSYKEGKGGVDVSKRQFDKSTNAVDQKVSLPIINEQGQVIGAVCMGIKVDMLNQTAVASGN